MAQPSPQRVSARWLRAASVPLHQGTESEFKSFKRWGNSPYDMGKRFQGTLHHLHVPHKVEQSQQAAIRAGKAAAKEYVSGMEYARSADVYKIIAWPDGTFSPIIKRLHSVS